MRSAASDVAQFAVERLEVVDVTQPETSEFRLLVSTHDNDAYGARRIVTTPSKDFIFIRFTHHYNIPSIATHAEVGAVELG